MKKIFTTLSLCLCLVIGVSAQTSLYFDPTVFQSVNSGTTAIAPHASATPGLTPADSVLPCALQGVAVSDTIYFTNFTTFSIATVNSLKIDSLYLPTGLTWATTHANNTFTTGESGVIYVSGTTNVAPGVYKLRIIADIDATIIGQIHNANAETLAHLRYHVRVTTPTCGCQAINPADSNSVYTAYNCNTSGPPTATISPAGNVNVCVGASQTLTAAAGGGYTYKWSTGATTQAITVTAAGSYQVTVHNATDSAVSAPTVITIVTPTSVSVSPVGPDTICAGTSATLTATPAGLTYAWTGGTTTQSLSATASGTYTVTATDANHCTATSNTVIVYVTTPPTPAVLRAGYTLTTTGGTSYQWYKDGGVISGQTSSSLTVTANGSYTVETTYSNGCSAFSAATSVINVGINDVAGNSAVRLYPNPSEGLLTLETSSRSGDKYEIYDAIGRTVMVQTISADKTLIDMSAQQSGIYFLSIKHAAATETIRFSVVK